MRQADNSGPGAGPIQTQANTRQIQTTEQGQPSATSTVTSLLMSSSDSESGEGVREVRIEDGGSQQQFADVLIQGVLARGIVDTGAEIIIIGGELFECVAAVARLKKSRLKPADKVPKAYDNRIFTLDGKMELVIAYQGRTMQTPIYIKLDAPEQLLLGEGVCRQLGIVTYHPLVCNQRKKKNVRASQQMAKLGDKGQQGEVNKQQEYKICYTQHTSNQTKGRRRTYPHCTNKREVCGGRVHGH